MIKLNDQQAYYAKVIVDNLSGRELVCYGDIDKHFENYLKQNFNLKFAFRVFHTENLCDGEKIRSSKVLDHKSAQYFVVCFSQADIEKNTKWLQHYGYMAGKDYVYMGCSKTTVPQGVVGWFDGRRNFVSYCPNNCEIVFTGYDSKVNIPTDIKIKDKLRIEVGSNCNITFEGKTRVEDASFLCFDCSEVIIGNNVSFGKAMSVFVYQGASFRISGNVSFVKNTKINASHYTSIVIGNDCMFSQDNIIFAGDGHAIFDCMTQERKNSPLNCGDEKRDKFSVVIGDHVWVGIRSIILNKTKIGSGSIVGAGSVVKGTFPNNCAIAGNPAKVISENVAWSRNIMDMDIEACGEGYYNLTEHNE